MTTVGNQVARSTETDRVTRRSTRSTQVTRESSQSSGVTQANAPPQRDGRVEPEAQVPAANVPAPGGEGKTYLVSTRHGVTEEYAWYASLTYSQVDKVRITDNRWRTASATVGVPGTHQHKVRDDRLRDQVHAMIDQEARHNVPPDHDTPETVSNVLTWWIQNS